MANKMLIDASHPEETRVVVVRGQKVEEFDFESATRKQLRGNIYLAKVTRVEPSLQAAFVEYGGNRHGFLAFSEIHPDYYQIPVADRQALIEADARADREEEREDERRRQRGRRPRNAPKRAESTDEKVASEPVAEEGAEAAEEASRHEEFSGGAANEISESAAGKAGASPADREETAHAETGSDESAPSAEASTRDASSAEASPGEAPVSEIETEDPGEQPLENGDDDAEPVIEQVGGRGDALEELPERPRQHRRQYKIQEVIKRRQILLVQVVKEERGTKGAALTTYLSLAGRYSVLMPNTGRGGGISRKITSAADRKRLKEIAQDLEVPEGMGVILRTAGASRTRAEIKRDFEYLMRLWESVRELTMSSSAPALVYEEGSLIKRAIRDLYNKDIEEILVSGDEAYREAKDFMRMLMPSHAKAVKPYKDPQPLFARSGVEAQLDAMFSNHVTLKSGGYLVINPTEALVSIDVNSGRATREHNIEDTALKTNMEAAEEIARQLRLRDLAGLIVIDFIDMEEKRNNRSVEKKLNECLKNDRARIQVGRISPFGLLEMSRQRIRTGVLESSSVPCPHCGGAGHVRATPSVALHILRSVEETLIRSATHNLCVRTRTEVAFYILNQKRTHLRELEHRFGVAVAIMADEQLGGATTFAVDRMEPALKVEHKAPAASVQIDAVVPVDEPEEVEDAAEELDAAQPGEAGDAQGEEGEGNGRRRRRRRRRRGRGETRDDDMQASGSGESEHAEDEGDAEHDEPETAEALETADAAAPRRHRESDRDERRGRRGRRGRGRDRGDREPRSIPIGEFRSGEREEGSELAPTDRPQGEPEAERPAAARSRPNEIPAADAPVEETASNANGAGAVNGDESIAGSAPAAAPEPEPVAVVLTPPDPDRPKRAGWWSRAKTAIGGS
jgi:ribonuclease E